MIDLIYYDFPIYRVMASYGLSPEKKQGIYSLEILKAIAATFS